MLNIIQNIQKHHPVSEEALQELCSIMNLKEYPKNTIFVQAGSIDRNIYFIEKGITRSFFIHNDKEVTTWFSSEGDVTFGMGSVYYRQPSTEYVETIEPCTIYTVPIDTLNALYEKHIDLANWGRILHQNGYYKITHIHVDKLHLSPKERYELFREYFPNIVNRIKLKYIAAFLGMSIYTLSRVRSSKT